MTNKTESGQRPLGSGATCREPQSLMGATRLPNAAGVAADAFSALIQAVGHQIYAQYQCINAEDAR